MITLERFNSLKKQVESHQRQADKDQGMLDSLTQQLLTSLECSTLQEAEKIVSKMEKEVIKLNKEVGESEKKLREDYPDLEF